MFADLYLKNWALNDLIEKKAVTAERRPATRYLKTEIRAERTAVELLHLRSHEKWRPCSRHSRLGFDSTTDDPQRGRDRL